MKSWSLNAKIILVLTLFALGGASIATIGTIKINEINASLNNLVDKVAQRLLLAKSLDAATNEIRSQERAFVIHDTEEGMRAIGEDISVTEKRIMEYLAQYRELADDSVKISIDKLAAHLEEWRVINKKVQGASLAGNNQIAIGLIRDQSDRVLGEFDKILTELVDRNEGIMAAESKATDELVAMTSKTILTISLSALLACSLLAFFILRALNRAIDKVISNLDDSSNQVTSAAQQIAASSEELSQAATEQAASLEETASSIEEMNSMVQKNSENAQQTASVSGTSKDSADKGKQVVGDMINAIDGINSSNNSIMNQIDDSNRQISEIVQVIAEIGNKTKIINDIVFQTKLLSFNASVEAARAGEHGKGFAVVAEEVGNLAQVSGNAAKEISEMLDGSIQKVEGIVADTTTKVGRLIAEGKEKVETGTRIAQQCGSVLNEIVESVSSVGHMASEISIACQEQSQGVQEITKAMGQLDQVTQENASTSEEAASAAEELSSQAEALREVVQVLIKTVKGDREGGAQASSSAKAPSSHKAKVLHMQSGKFKTSPAPTAEPKTSLKGEFKKAAGFDNGSIPSENDPRFEDI